MARIAAVTNKGSFKSANEDACCIRVATTSLGETVMAVVCDGVGGLDRGQEASSWVARRFSAWFCEELPLLILAMGGSFDARNVLDEWNCLLIECNETLSVLGRRGGQRMATTFTGVIACSGTYVVGQVGDSRLYVVRRGTCCQITQDQTLVAQLVSQGELTAEEASSHPYNNVILQAIGASDDLCPVFTAGTLEPDDLFVLCTDGAYRTLGPDEFARSFDPRAVQDDETLDAACQALVARAIEAGEHDNLTIGCFSLASSDGVAGEKNAVGEV